MNTLSGDAGNEGLLKARRELNSAVIDDVLSSLGYRHQFLPPRIQPLRDSCVICGRAMPVLGADDIVDEDQAGVNTSLSEPFGLMLRALDDLSENEVYICSGTSPDYALWSELMSLIGLQRGASGAVVNGWSRDTREILKLGFPCFSFGPYAKDQRPGGKIEDFRCRIQIEEVVIRPADIIFGDLEGVVVIPAELENEVFRLAREKLRGGQLVRNGVQNGLGAQEAWNKFCIL